MLDANRLIMSYSRNIPEFMSADAKMSVEIYADSGSGLTNADCEEIAEQNYSILLEKAKADYGGLPYGWSEVLENKRIRGKEYSIRRSIGFNKESELGKAISNKVIIELMKKHFLVYLPHSEKFRIVPHATMEKLKKIGFERKDLYSNPCVDFLLPKRGNKQLDRKNCESSLPKID